MTSRNAAKGRRAESAVTGYLSEHGWPYAERRRLAGVDDKGDVTGTPGLAWEIRARRRLDLPGWLRDAADRRRAAHADVGLLVVKPDGLGETNVDRWAVVLTLADACDLLRAAGYGQPADSPATQQKGD